MELVIKIPYGTYDAIQQGLTNQVITNKLWESVKIGTPLPKNHGRLIDADNLLNQFPIWVDNVSSATINMIILKAPTIIEGSDAE